ncbi:chemotaxis protein CheW [Paramagnetospirillum magneticum]|uniref:Chemotaxis signal transduction protein n=1 Tax=Paramagnetospirillum magneticum (strain ATCC 700264 / AMB-1) TaxID=342108 RepID=Q2W5V7_PARM1|nr:chemotaxis protein CheW [Paramagnetospirillum magneticum]BAE50768.1 Chemotaxis signal transduction protein [Paramagnetospirillum magneticum AMB-1]
MSRRGETILDRLHALGEQPLGWSEAEFAEGLLRARARRLAAPRGLSDRVEAGFDVLGARIANERYAFPLEALSEVMLLARWTPVPGQPQYLLGVTNLRGEIRPVLDLHSLLGLTPPAPEARTWVIFLKAGGAEVGVRVDGLDRGVRLDPSAMTRPQESGNGLPQRFISGITPDALILLDTVQLLALDALKDTRVEGLDE